MTAIEVDSDMFVAPGVDNIFPLIRREINKDYRLPMLPVHFLDKGPKDGADWWPRFCQVDGRCRWQTTRWGHAHPTWTYHALPFFGRWLRRNLRDETLPPRLDAGPKAATTRLRVSDVPGVEDLLNVAV